MLDLIRKLLGGNQVKSGIRIGGVFEVTCRRPDGSIRWQDTAKNIVTTEGLNHILDILFAGDTQINPWYVGLLGSSPSPAAEWTKTEVGAADFVDYDEATLQAYVDARSSQTVSNTASKAAFTIDTNSSTIGGAFLASASTKAVEGGAAEILCAAAFSGGDKSADDDDTLEVTYTFTAADDGA